VNAEENEKARKLLPFNSVLVRFEPQFTRNTATDNLFPFVRLNGHRVMRRKLTSKEISSHLSFSLNGHNGDTRQAGTLGK
jgi:hypothetical protein